MAYVSLFLFGCLPTSYQQRQFNHHGAQYTESLASILIPPHGTTIAEHALSPSKSMALVRLVNTGFPFHLNTFNPISCGAMAKSLYTSSMNSSGKSQHRNICISILTPTATLTKTETTTI
ncbi:uncharacterized protein EURHEDRAFT_411797 [Aspergillus ruber CBS 135680]|uniref:Uncharacterized protein n=1 Tax=Aspergillus ruber (strain CBS 135680) TaxID=1388766 RepID=A0A017SFV0_ASPRC|nr:uncharacterized protein EURHEDRAFT_411797 [Aspergillus ruber CBS 135680]EYE95509.1 hypothetical protein EURHEDRAFT_411797 [Aspergillus ruber CBS 135680]